VPDLVRYRPNRCRGVPLPSLVPLCAALCRPVQSNEMQPRVISWGPFGLRT